MATAVIGFFIAFVIGLTGVGAGTIAAPVLIFYLGLDPIIAIGTSLLFGTIVKIPAWASFASQKSIHYDILKNMLSGGIPGVLAGALIIEMLGRNEQFKIYLIALVGILILISALLNLVLLFRKAGEHGIDKHEIIPWLSFFIGAEVGFSSVGAGALGTLLLIFATSLPLSKIIGTHILFGLILSAIGGGLHVGMGNIDYPVLLLLSIGGVFGSAIGARAVNYIPNRPMKLAILVWLFFIGTQMLLKSLSL